MYSDIMEPVPSRGAKNLQLRSATKGSGKKGGKGSKGKGGKRLEEGGKRSTTVQAPVVLKEVLSMDRLSRILSDDAKQAAYRRRKGEVKTTLHWNDRKLLLYEMEFLTEYAGCSSATVVYLGAHPGTHIKTLSSFFPLLNFLLIDTQPPACDESKRIRIIQQRLTDRLIRELDASFARTKTRVLLISNLKNRAKDATDWENAAAKDSWTEGDQQKQFEICSLFSTLSGALLKFRLPYTAGTTVVPAGRIFLPVYGGQTSTETRYVPDLPLSDATRKFDHQSYEQMMFYFNTVARLQTYPEYCSKHSSEERHIYPVGGEGFDWRYDTTTEISTLINYILACGPSYAKFRKQRLEREARREKGKEKRTRGEDKEDAIVTDEVVTLLTSDPSGEVSQSGMNIIVKILSSEISTELSRGRHSLITQPLTYLHEPRSVEHPFNQRLRQEVAGTTTLQSGVEQTELDDNAPPAPSLATLEVDEKPLKPVSAVLSNLGLDVDFTDSDDSDASSDAPPVKRKKEDTQDESNFSPSATKADGYLAALGA